MKTLSEKPPRPPKFRPPKSKTWVANCPACRGKGKVYHVYKDGERCGTCGGAGRLRYRYHGEMEWTESTTYEPVWPCSAVGCGQEAEEMGQHPGPFALRLCATHTEEMNEAMSQIPHSKRRGEP